ncbi:hypothetical protein BGW80DRAFT_1251401 [Lactifluus volemus]|nr:hypothetical protein BGW80DRAFT_1251401 [Lactifluus volemus]
MFRLVDPAKLQNAAELDRICSHVTPHYCNQSGATLKKAFQCPPNGQGSILAVKYRVNGYTPRTGITALMALGILESMREQGLVGNILEMEHNSAGYLNERSWSTVSSSRERDIRRISEVQDDYFCFERDLNPDSEAMPACTVVVPHDFDV